MKRLAVVVSLVTTTLTSTVDAHAAPVCATPAEYAKVHKGQSLEKVRNIFGGREGYSYDLGTIKQKSWHKCNAGETYAQVDFRKGKVAAKRWTH